MPTATDMEGAWNALMSTLGETEWIEHIQWQSLTLFRFVPASGLMYKWVPSDSKWTQLTTLEWSAVLTTGAVETTNLKNVG